jgi:hypothetical protein
MTIAIPMRLSHTPLFDAAGGGGVAGRFIAGRDTGRAGVGAAGFFAAVPAEPNALSF